VTNFSRLFTQGIAARRVDDGSNEVSVTRQSCRDSVTLESTDIRTVPAGGSLSTQFALLRYFRGM
jgi:hypothetical protein